jgi:flavin reductase (DIM6/NTAB) family NADH-FMN oxidoreductase RutF
MDEATKKTALRMIPYGIYVLTAEDSGGAVGAATVNWVTQTAFEPPLLVVGVKSDSGPHAVLKSSGSFGLNILGKEQQGVAFAFFKPAEKGDGTISGEPYRRGSLGVPILENAIGCLECKVVEIVERGDHHIVVGEVAEAHVPRPIEGRPDLATLHMADLGENVFYGG